MTTTGAASPEGAFSGTTALTCIRPAKPGAAPAYCKRGGGTADRHQHFSGIGTGRPNLYAVARVEF